MPDEKLPFRTLKTGFWLTVFFMLIFTARGQTGIALGLGIGAGVALFSLWTLMYTIPRLLTRDNPAAKVWLGMILCFKMPVYAVVLWFAMGSSAINPFAVAVGVALVPAVLVLKVLGYRLIQNPDSAGDDTCRNNPVQSN